jgi:hypothetical protein
MTPQETLDSLKNTTNSRSHRALDAIYEICTEQIEMGESDFSFSTIAKLGEKRHVPKAQSIRNKTGEPYRTLINSFAKSCNNKSLKKSLRVNTTEDEWIERIKDANIKLLVKIQAAELKNAQRLIKEFLPINKVIEVNDFPGRKENKENDALSSLERNALEYLLTPEFLEKEKLTIGKRGEMTNANGKVTFRIATVDAIKKALEFL